MHITKVNLAAVGAVLLAGSALAAEAKKEGVIISQNANILEVRTRAGLVRVAVTPGTRIREVKGLSKKEREARTLIPGLIIKVEGDQQGDMLTADKIEFKERDWRSAIATTAGTTQKFEKAAEERAELRRAIVEGQEYVIREETTVYFATGSSAIAEQHKQQLRALAQKAPSHGNYRVSILGFADPRGNAEANERLSLKRAMAVSTYLRQTGLIQPGRVLSPSAMGEGTAAPGEGIPASNDEARRVVVRVLTPKTQLR